MSDQYTPNTGQVKNAYGAHMGDCHKVTSTALEEFDRWLANYDREIKEKARAEAFMKARQWLNHITSDGLISKADVPTDLDLWAERAARGVQPDGNPYKEE